MGGKVLLKRQVIPDLKEVSERAIYIYIGMQKETASAKALRQASLGIQGKAKRTERSTGSE